MVGLAQERGADSVRREFWQREEGVLLNEIEARPLGGVAREEAARSGL